MSGLNLTAADDAINELERASAAAERSRIVALLDRDDVIEALTMAAFEDEEKARASLCIKHTEWQSVGRSFQDNWRSRTRASCAALAELIEKSDA